MTKELARYFFTLIDKDLYFDKVEEFIRKRYGEHENTSKPKRKFRAKTYLEFCKSFDGYCSDCPFADEACGYKGNKPCKVNGKYILVEVKE